VAAVDSPQPAASDETAQSILTGTRAMALAQATTQALRLLTNVVLARLLLPEDFGIVAVATVVSLFLEQLRDLGMGSALIQRKRLDHAIINTVFYLNLLLGLGLGLLVALSAGPLASAMGEPRSASILRLFAAVTFLTSTAHVHNALLRRELRFGKVGLITVVSAVVTSVVGITLAAFGVGAWALALGMAAGNLTGGAMAWGFDPWRPSAPGRFAGFAAIRSYSTHLLLVNLLNFAFMQSDKILVSRSLGAAALGIYAMAQRILTYPLAQLASVVNEVVFPALSRQQDDEVALRKGFVRAAAVVGLVTFPLMAGLASVATPLVNVILGRNWGQLVPLIWILAPVGAIQSVTISASNLLLMARGRTDLLFRWSLVNSGVTVAAYVIGVRYGLVGITAAYAIAVLVLTPFGLRLAFRQIHLRLGQFVSALWPVALCAAAAAGASLLAQWAVPAAAGSLTDLAVAVPAGVLVYLGLLLLLRPPALQDALSVVRGRRGPLP
jgi:PST family polysaccharide transporter